MKVFIFILILTGTLSAETCFLKGEVTSGFNKICYYECLSGDYAVNIKATQLCKLSVNR
jgi:hypothetical protein